MISSLKLMDAPSDRVTVRFVASRVWARAAEIYAHSGWTAAVLTGAVLPVLFDISSPNTTTRHAEQPARVHPLVDAQSGRAALNRRTKGSTETGTPGPPDLFLRRKFFHRMVDRHVQLLPEIFQLIETRLYRSAVVPGGFVDRIPDSLASDPCSLRRRDIPPVDIVVRSRGRRRIRTFRCFVDAIERISHTLDHVLDIDLDHTTLHLFSPLIRIPPRLGTVPAPQTPPPE